ncbi:MAG: DMT family transporter [Nitrospinae bacterium]|nr:DMT family transporter [Nitrospinota bacterium]
MTTWLERSIGWIRIEPLMAVILWGGIYPGVKLGLRDIPVLSFTTVRILLAMMVLWLVSGPLTLSRSLWQPLLSAGLAQTMFQALLIAGLHRTTAGNSAILLATAPMLTAGGLMLTGRERLRGLQWCGLALGFGGVGFVIQGGGVGLAWSHLGGDLLAMGAAGAWAWYGLAIGPLVRALGTLQATGWTMAVAALFFLPLSLTELAAHPWTHVGWEAWAGLIYGATLGMVIAMALWGRAIHQLGPRQTMIYVYLEPVSAVVIAAALLGESLGPLQVVGALLTFIGVWLASRVH